MKTGKQLLFYTNTNKLKKKTAHVLLIFISVQTDFLQIRKTYVVKAKKEMIIVEIQTQPI